MKATVEKVVDHKKVLGQLSKLIEKEESCLDKIYSDPQKIKEKKENLDITRKKKGEEFFVLFIGAFSSGKSSMINALIGYELLPTGFLPETAVLGEIHYGEKKEIWLYPKKGMWEGGDQPFKLTETTTEEIEKYVSLSADDAINTMEEEEGCNKKINSKFEKMVIYWPLDILKDGVVFVDSPGINDPYSNDYIVNGYLPKADAIIYVMDSAHAYQGTDREQLETINGIGRKNIITGYTFYDLIVENNGKKREKLEKVCNTLIRHMEKHSDLGSEAIHFLDSLEGLRARMEGDEEALRRSGFEGFENYLERYLVEGKGKDQVKNMATTVVRQAEIMMKDADRLNSAADQDEKELGKRADDAESQLSIVRSNSFNTGRNYRNHLQNYIPKAETMVRDFVKELPQQIDLEGFEPETELPSGPRKLWPFGENGANKRAKAIQEECQHEMERRMNAALTKWSNDTLGTYMKDAVQESVKAIRPDLEQIARDLDDITTHVSGEVKMGDGTWSNIAMGLAYSVLTGDWFTGGMSAIYGKGVMAKGIAAQFGTGLLMGALMALGAPITLPMVVVGGIAASISVILAGNNEKKVEKIKTEAVKKLREQFNSEEAAQDVEKNVVGIMKNVDAYVENACSDMDKALAEDIKATEDNIQQMIDESKFEKEKKIEQIKERNAAVIELKKLKDQALEICGEYNIDIADAAVGI